ncbi:hypothetical protein JW721_05260 [Candidatus Micrarchaeota archaeon]|nr:hypothetical protein [Candidatus Micrarchaeota archaeon]
MLDVWTYPGEWTLCVNYSLLALEERGTTLNSINDEYGAERQKFIDGGACGAGYAGAGTEYCGMGEVDVMCDYSNMTEDIPRFDWYYDCILRHNAAIGIMADKLVEIEDAYTDVELLCDQTVVEITARRGAAEGAMAELESEELDHIYKSAEESASATALGLGNEYARLVEIMELADDAALSAGFGHTHKGETNWMEKCLMDGGTAIGAYNEILDSTVLEEAEEIVNSRGKEAHLALVDAAVVEDNLGDAGRSVLETAKKECEEGDDVDSPLGERFGSYSKCLLHAQLAIESAEGGEDIITAQRETDLGLVEGILDRAKKDGIDVLNEERMLSALSATNDPDYMGIVEGIREGVLAKAEYKYPNLEAQRSELLSWISMKEGSFGYLETWFEKEECYTRGELDYMCALGSLLDIQDSYEEIRADIEANKDVFVGERMLVGYSQQIGIVELDEKSEVYLYVEASNPLPFSAEGVVLDITTDFDFRKVDILEGSENVSVVLGNRGGIEIHLSEIGAKETQLIVFKREEIVCRIVEYEETAYGDAYGGAAVLQEAEAYCNCPVEGLVLGEPFEAGGKVALNGIEVEVNSLGGMDKSMGEGKHEIAVESYDYGAYNVDREVAFVSSLGTETAVELFFIFHPQRDLEYITFSSNEAAKDLEDLEIFGYTGERIEDKKVIGNSTIFFKVKNLVGGRDAKVRVSYEISDIEGFVKEAIQEYSQEDLTASEESLLEDARSSTFIGDYPEAYSSLEELRGLLEKRGKEHTNALEKDAEIREKISSRITELESALSFAEGLGVDNGYVTEIEARLGELHDSLETEVPEGATVGPLEAVDLGWEKKELTKISKELLSLENKLKSRWLELGAHDLEMEEIIEDVESKNSQFAGTLDFEDAMEAFYLIEMGEGRLWELEKEHEAAMEGKRLELGEYVNQAYGLLIGYEEEYSAADGTHLESLFPRSPSELKKELKEISSSDDFEEGILQTTEIISSMEKLDTVLEEEGKRLEEEVLALYANIKEELPEADSESVLRSLEAARAYRSEGEYVLAIKSLETGISKLENFEKEESGILVLAITGLLILGVIGLYLANDKLPEGILPQKFIGGKKEGKKYRKLKREN